MSIWAESLVKKTLSSASAFANHSTLLHYLRNFSITEVNMFPKIKYCVSKTAFIMAGQLVMGRLVGKKVAKKLNFSYR